MLIESYRNGSIGYMLGKRTFTIPDTYYLGLSTTPISVDGSGITEPATASGYQRVAIPNNISSWTAPSNGVTTNVLRLEFPELTTDSGQAVWCFLAEGATGNCFWADALPNPRPLAQYTTIFIEPGNLQYAISNTQTVPAIPSNP